MNFFQPARNQRKASQAPCPSTEALSSNHGFISLIQWIHSFKYMLFSTLLGRWWSNLTFFYEYFFSDGWVQPPSCGSLSTKCRWMYVIHGSVMGLDVPTERQDMVNSLWACARFGYQPGEAFLQANGNGKCMEMSCWVRCLGIQNPLQNHLQKGLEHKGFAVLTPRGTNKNTLWRAVTCQDSLHFRMFGHDLFGLHTLWFVSVLVQALVGTCANTLDDFEPMDVANLLWSFARRGEWSKIPPRCSYTGFNGFEWIWHVWPIDSWNFAGKLWHVIGN